MSEGTPEFHEKARKVTELLKSLPKRHADLLKRFERLPIVSLDIDETTVTTAEAMKILKIKQTATNSGNFSRKMKTSGFSNANGEHGKWFQRDVKSLLPKD